MNPQRFAASNIVMKAPAGMDNCSDVHAWKGRTSDGQPVTITAWTPTAEERVKLAMGEPLYLWIYGDGMPPVALSAADPFEANPDDSSAR